MPGSLELYNLAKTAILSDFVDLGGTPENVTIDIASFIIENIGDETCTNIRCFCRPFNGLYTGQDNSAGQEIVTGKMVQFRENLGAWQSTGGDFSGGGSPSPAANYFPISDIAAGADSLRIDARIVITAAVLMAGRVFFQIGVNYQGEAF